MIFKITRADHYPQPFNPVKDPRIFINFALTQNADRVVFSLYTSGYRMILRKELGSANAGLQRAMIEVPEARTFSNGSYFWVIEAENGESGKVRHRPNTLIILK